jgi:hypothetical protein
LLSVSSAAGPAKSNVIVCHFLIWPLTAAGPAVFAGLCPDASKAAAQNMAAALLKRIDVLLVLLDIRSEYDLQTELDLPIVAPRA